jgi:hypothetical protein
VAITQDEWEKIRSARDREEAQETLFEA